MPYVVCAEEMEGRWIAHIPDLPGCFAAHDERDEAIAAAPKAVEAYVAWCAAAGVRISGVSPPMVVSEVVRAWQYEPEYEVNAFFAADRPPVAADELPEYQRLLEASRRDLLQAVEGLGPEAMQRTIPGEPAPLGGIVHLVARTELWYLDRLGLAFPHGHLSPEPLDAIQQVRQQLVGMLTALSSQTGVVALAGEVWSARKVLRRTLWHERDQTRHILDVRARMR